MQDNSPFVNHFATIEKLKNGNKKIEIEYNKDCTLDDLLNAIKFLYEHRLSV